MCGFAGWYRRSSQAVAPEHIRRQCDAIVHRGPDDDGYFLDGDFGFGMRRLSIIDIAGGAQPMTSADGRYVIVSNGEIYNHMELRRDLEAAGRSFSTRSDTETLLASYLHWGDDAWPRLEGMYATAIWDRRDRVLTLARDPLGIKPLYITQQNGGIAFASEIRSLRVLPHHEFGVNERAVHDFFKFGHVQRPRSIFSEVRSLDPGHVLRIGPDGGASVKAFWTPSFQLDPGLSEDEWIEETRSRLLDTVKRHMLSDVPLGVFLSGGVDSSAMAAAMTQLDAAPFKAFTIGFPNSQIDETEAASRIARHLGIEHIVLPLEPAKTAELLPAVQSAFDEPCAATSAVPHWHLSRLAAEHVKVVLCGEGSDEIFAGYKRQRTALNAARWSPLIRGLGPLANMLQSIPTTSSTKLNYLKQNASRFVDSARLDNSFQRFFAGTQMSSPGTRQRLYDPGFLARHDSSRPFARLEEEYFPSPELRKLEPLQQFQLADLTVHMPGSLLTRLDRPSMAHSLEARVPFLSHKFVDWTLSMPISMKLRGKTGKYVLRKAAEPWLPKAALDMRKLGFQLPFAEWFRSDFSEFAREAWNDSGASKAGYLNERAVEELFAEHRTGIANHGRMLYALAMFGCWWTQNMPAPAKTAVAA
ncbi:asparagine synthase (glutamine-hydrolyzing) [Tsuneonella sp. CC-YZS046]|uniref:asparagine synthase (glutamine-hydrolyzing) n=1 Tax=Tsuneonella sp. CC-YZS046 TaxID=3042152 RepID=UPI002D78EB66|nr:asparagine synthase (glutamine-hydrolyzing) [Tsuneonella sp. CC-YZS046]WRO67786.1 asparagine synthase (glutamine-hydrolyzing) [Tsuneonella sp. CC-YZS046]